jgi:hypothetical protein
MNEPPPQPLRPAEVRTPHFEAIDNWRDVATAMHGLLPGRCFRSAHPGGATERDCVLLESFGIRTAIDLRSHNEVSADPPRSPYRQHFRAIIRFIPLTGWQWIFRLFYNAPLSVSA